MNENRQSETTFELPIRGDLWDLRLMMRDIQERLQDEYRRNNPDIPYGPESAYEWGDFEGENTFRVRMRDLHKDEVCGCITARRMPNGVGAWLNVWHYQTPTAAQLWQFIYAEIQKRGFVDAEPAQTISPSVIAEKVLQLELDATEQGGKRYQAQEKARVLLQYTEDPDMRARLEAILAMHCRIIPPQEMWHKVITFPLSTGDGATIEAQPEKPARPDTTRDSGHYHFSPQKRKEIVEEYRQARATGNVTNKEAWARNRYGITGKTLLAYEREFPE